MDLNTNFISQMPDFSCLAWTLLLYENTKTSIWYARPLIRTF